METMVEVSPVRKIMFRIFHIVRITISYDFPLKYTINNRTEH